MSNQGAHISALQESLGVGYENYPYEGLWHAYWDSQSIADGTYNERMLTWINDQLGTSYNSLARAKHEFAVDAGYDNWDSLAVLTLLVNNAKTWVSTFSSNGEGWHVAGGADPSIYIKDLTTPANNVDVTRDGNRDAFESVFDYTSPSAKFGMLSTGLVGFFAHNLALQSDNFDAAWTLSNVTNAGGFLTATSTGSVFVSQSITTGPGETRQAFKVKAGTSPRVLLRTIGFDNGTLAYFDVLNGVAESVSGGTSSISSEPDADGYYTCSVVWETASDLTGFVYAYIVDNDGSTAVTSGRTLYVKNAHVHRAPVDETYLPTTTAPRYSLPFEWNIADQGYRLNTERGSTNYALHSNDLTNAAWLTGGSMAPTADHGTGPDGVATSTTRLTWSAGSGVGNFVHQSIVNSPNVDNTVSAWVRSTGGGADQLFRLKCTHAGVLDYYSADLTATSEWQRFEFTASHGASGSGLFAGIVGPSTNVAGDIEVKFFQAELNKSSASSVIITAGSAVSRAGDNIFKPISELRWSNTEGSMQFDAVIPPNDLSRYLAARTGSARYAYGNGGSADLRAYNGANIVSFGSPAEGASVKMVTTFSASKIATFRDGVKINENISPSNNNLSLVATGTTIQIGSLDGSNFFWGADIQAIGYVPEAVSDADAITMTEVA